jgi:hypothetical protein
VVPSILAVIQEPVTHSIDDILAVAISLADEAGLQDHVTDTIRTRLQMWLGNATPLAHAETFLKAVQFMVADPFSVLPLADSLRSGGGHPPGLPNLKFACFMNAGVQAVVSSDTAVMALASTVFEEAVAGVFTLQQGFLSTVASLASASGDAALPVDAFMSWLIPDLLKWRQSCTSEALQAVFRLTPLVTCATVSTAGKPGRVALEGLLRDPVALTMGSAVDQAGCLVIGVNPSDHEHPVNMHSVIFNRTMVVKDVSWTLKAVVFYEPGLDQNGVVTMSVGHYWTVAKRGDLWWRFNDEVVERAPHGPEFFCSFGGIIVTTLVYDRS